MQENLKSAKMGSMPIAKLLITMSLPAMLSMLVQALYNVVDSIFIGQYDPSAALIAINIAMPFQMLPIALALGIGVGTNAIVSKCLGEGKGERASLCAQTGLLMAGATYILVIFMGFFLSGVYAQAFSEGNQSVAELTTQYLQIVVCCSGFMFLEVVLNKILQATGNMIVPMFSQLIGAITNIILDPFFINGYWFFPELGIRGAAVATVIGQAFAMLFVLLVFIFKKQDVSVNFKSFKLKLRNVKRILIVGFPTAVLNGLTSVTTILMYAILVNNTAKTVLGLYFKVQSFVFMPVFGLNQGAMPIMGYNFGRGDKKRFLHTYWLSIVIAACIMILGMILLLTASDFLLGLFNVTQGEALQMGQTAFKIICFSFLPAAFGIITITMLQSTQNGILAMLVSICRQLVFLVPMAFIIKLIAGDVFLNYVWWCYPIAEILAVSLSLPFGRWRARKSFADLLRERQKQQLQLSAENTTATLQEVQ
ncbi:MAG: MATE family efflux transporter [Clostridia bacterium]|nr:MATE family efflux transporter [Clostridia bacterium]